MKRRLTIGVITTECFRRHTSDMMCGIITQAFQADCNVVILSVKNNFIGQIAKHDYYETDLYQLAKSPNFDGFIYDRNFFYNDAILKKLNQLLKQTQKPVMLLDSSVPPYFENTVSHDPEAFERLVEHLITIHGYKKIYCLTGFKGMPQSEERLEAYFNIMKRHKLYYDETYYSYGDFWRDEPIQYAKRILRGELSKPEAIVCASDIMADTLIDTLQKGGISVPEDIAVTGFDGYLDHPQSDISLTSFKKSYFHLGADALRRLYGIITGKQCKRIHNSNDGIMIGRSCGCLPLQDKNPNANRDYRLAASTEETFLYSNFLFNSLHASSLEELLSVINDNIYHIYRWNKFRIFLTEDFWAQLQGTVTNNPSSNKVAYREVLRCDRAGSGITPSTEKIRASELPSYLSQEAPYPTAYYLSPLHVDEIHYGIAALSFGKTPYCYKSYYITFINYICAALEMLLKQKKTEYALQELSIDKMKNIENPRLYSQLSQIRRELLQNPELDWNIHEICQRVHVSRSYLQRMYKNYFGKSIFEELIDARLEKAKKLLAETDTSISQIAEYCGYTSYSHFANQFKATEKITPSQYRERNQKTEPMSSIDKGKLKKQYRESKNGTNV